MTAVDLFANQAQTTITAGGDTAPAQGAVESWTPASPAGFPVASPEAAPPTQFRVQDPAQPNEKVLVTDSRTTPWIVTRGAEGTEPVAHAPDFAIQQILTAGALEGFLQGNVSGDKNYTQTFNVASTVTVTHNLGKYPSVTVFDSASNEIEGDVDYTNLNNLTLSFSAPFSGTVTCN
jgi:hypothetical protein